MAGNGGNGSKWIRPVKRLAIYLRDGEACVYCGACLEDGAQLTLDHLIARELGGENEPTNLVTSCLPCNSRKRALTIRQFMQFLRDGGIDTAGMADRIRKHTARKLDSHMTIAKDIMAQRTLGSAEETE